MVVVAMMATVVVVVASPHRVKHSSVWLFVVEPAPLLNNSVVSEARYQHPAGFVVLLCCTSAPDARNPRAVAASSHCASVGIGQSHAKPTTELYRTTVIVVATVVVAVVGGGVVVGHVTHTIVESAVTREPEPWLNCRAPAALTMQPGGLFSMFRLFAVTSDRLSATAAASHSVRLAMAHKLVLPLNSASQLVPWRCA